MKYRCGHGLIAAGAMTLLALPASANIILELDPGADSLITGGPGTGRAIYLQANEDFKIKAVGILGNLVQTSYDVVIYEGLGQGNNSVGNVLAIETGIAGGVGFD